MKKTTKFSLLALLLFASAHLFAHASKDTLSPSLPTFTVAQQNAEIAEIDRILVNSYLNHYCFSTNQEVLNAFGYTPEQVPTFTPEIVQARMKALDKETPFDLVYNNTVQGFIDLYAVRRRDISSKVLGMSQLYFPMIEEALARHGIPLEMKYLAIVESALNPTAISSAGAGGLWQFMVGTGKQYNLNVTSYQDDRFDAYKSTEAACKYLKFLYNTFGDWQLALAAYNSGPGNVNKAIRRSGGAKDFWSIKPYLPKETQGYVPAFIAVNYVMNHAAEYNLYPKKPLITCFEIDTVGTTSRVDFTVLSQVLNIPKEDIAYLNPSYKLKEIPDNGRKHYLVLPIDKLGLFMANEQLVYEQSKIKQAEPEPLLASNEPSNNASADNKTAKVVWENDWKSHKVRKGESLGGIADKYNVSLSELKKWNKIKGSKIVPGQSLKIQTKVKKTIYEESEKQEDAMAENKGNEAKPVNTSESDEEENYQQSTAPKTTPAAKKPEPKQPTYKYYTVQRGDTLYKIASAKGVSVDQIKKLNNGLKENKLSVGQKIKIKQI
jgi:membrane-bound lytic murein transglycosylase D